MIILQIFNFWYWAVSAELTFAKRRIIKIDLKITSISVKNKPLQTLNSSIVGLQLLKEGRLGNSGLVDKRYRCELTALRNLLWDLFSHMWNFSLFILGGYQHLKKQILLFKWDFFFKSFLKVLLMPYWWQGKWYHRVFF